MDYPRCKEEKESDDDRVIYGPVKLSNGFDDQKSSPLSNEETKGKASGIKKETSVKVEDATSSTDQGGGKQKAVEPVGEDTLQVISSSAVENRNTGIWFRLVASNQENTVAPLQQISTSFINVENRNMKLSLIKKYLVMKLNLKSEDEVELYLDNTPLDSSIILCNLLRYWISTREGVYTTYPEAGSSAADYVMVINYGRNQDT